MTNHRPQILVCMISIFTTILAFSVLYSSTPSEAAPKELLIGTSPAGGDLFPTGVGLAQVITNHGGLKATAQPTGGAVANIRLLNSGKIDMGIVNTAGLGLAVGPREPFKKKQDVVALMVMFNQYMYWFGKDKAGVHSWKDVDGKRIWIGTAGGMAFRLSKTIINKMNLKAKTMLSKTRLGAEAMRDGRLDAMTGWALGGNPTPFVEQVTSVYKMNFFGPPSAINKVLIDKYPGIVELEFPAGVYKHQDYKVKTVGFYSLLVANSRMSDKVGYAIAKALHQNQDAIKKASVTGRSIDIRGGSRLVPKGVKWQAGAVRYLKEAGVWKE